MTTVLGVDARGRPPFAVTRIQDDAIRRIQAVQSLEEALDAGDEVEVIAVDVALGHEDPGGDGDGLRACEAAARELLGEARDRVFVLPPPVVFEQASYHDALAACRANGWPELEAPLWFARERLQALAHRAGRDTRLHEVHPEVSFAHMGEGAPAAPDRYGDSWAALHERLQLLHAEGLRPEGLEADSDTAPRQALDACAAGWTAERIANGQARCLPAQPPCDPRTGREVAIHV